MKPTLLRLCAAALAAASFAGSAFAHRAWILPSSFTLSGEGQWVAVDGAVSNNLFYPNHVPLNLEGLTITGPDGAVVEAQNAVTGKYRSVFDVKLEKEGTYRISSGVDGYIANWEENGERKRWRGSAEKLEADGIEAKPDVEIARNVRRVESFVTLGSPSTTVFATEGTGLELKPVTHPNDVFAGEEVSFQFLQEGKPAAGIEVDVLRGNDRYRNAENGLKLTTNADGIITFTPAEAGPYWLSAETSGKSTLNGNEIGLRNAYVATFEALPL